MHDVPATIFQQLGAGRFVAMTGARNFLGSAEALSFRLPGQGFCKNGINGVRVRLTASDDYEITATKIRAGQLVTIEQRDGVYHDQLRDVFEDMTGLRTSL